MIFIVLIGGERSSKWDFKFWKSTAIIMKLIVKILDFHRRRHDRGAQGGHGPLFFPTQKYDSNKVRTSAGPRLALGEGHTAGLWIINIFQSTFLHAW